jgi:hypothetical protein
LQSPTLNDNPPAHAWRATRDLTTVTLAQRPDLAAAVPGVLASRWPAFLRSASPGHGADLATVLDAVPQHQVLLVDPDDQVLAVALSVPLAWDRTVDGLPQGWDGAVTAAADGAVPNTIAALAITMSPGATGRGLAARMVGALAAASAAAGIDAMIAPVRPVLKAHYPLTTMASYVSWRTADGALFDPWLRLHLRLGGVQVGVAFPSLTLRGTIAQWQDWTGLPLPAAGEYVIPGGLVPLTVDPRADLATYREPHVWFVHRTS